VVCSSTGILGADFEQIFKILGWESDTDGGRRGLLLLGGQEGAVRQWEPLFDGEHELESLDV
jgi:hypothetical protein